MGDGRASPHQHRQSCSLEIPLADNLSSFLLGTISSEVKIDNLFTGWCFASCDPIFGSRRCGRPQTGAQKRRLPVYQLHDQLDGPLLSMHSTPNVELLAHLDLFPDGTGAGVNGERSAAQSFNLFFRRHVRP
jgi:hypothetical protein